VLETACREAAAWQREGRVRPSFAISVNVSLIQLEEGGIVEEVTDALAESGLRRGSLTLELTETAFGGDARRMAALLQRLSDLDVELGVDDFGTGFSSLRHLQHFPIDLLKIPKPFVDGIGGPGDDSALAKAILEIADSLGLRVIAEGIERPEQAQRLRELGCRYGQGFLIDRPMPEPMMREALGRDLAAHGGD
jgi:EAL domain-containing protein (putative c-di-GMP-specific phosphodiesterase class I)